MALSMALITSSPQKYLFLWILIATNIFWALTVCRYWASYTNHYLFILTALCITIPILKGGINFHLGCWHHLLSCLPTFMSTTLQPRDKCLSWNTKWVTSLPPTPLHSLPPSLFRNTNAFPWSFESRTKILKTALHLPFPLSSFIS